MHICFVAWRDIAHPEAGGSELYVHRIGQELVLRGHRVTVRSAGWPGASRGEHRGGVEMVRRGGRLSVYPLTLLHLLSRQGRRYDVVVDVINGMPFGAAFVRPRSSVALIHHVHREQWHLIYPGLIGRFGWRIESWLVPRLYRNHTTVTVSNQSRADLEGLGHRTVAVVQNGIDIPAAGRQRTGDRLCVLARLVPHKRVDWAIDAVAELSERFDDLTLDVIGDGYLRDELQAHAAARGVSHRVRFHGHLTDHARDHILASATAVVLPSLKEGWGLALVEAAAVGVPGVAIATAGGVNEAIVHGQTGLIAHNFTEFVDACDRLISDDALNQRLGAQARARATTLRWSDAASALERLVKQSLSERRRR